MNNRGSIGGLAVLAAIVIGAAALFGWLTHTSHTGSAKDFEKSFVVTVDHYMVAQHSITFDVTYKNKSDKTFNMVELRQSATGPNSTSGLPTASIVDETQKFTGEQIVHVQFTMPLGGSVNKTVCPLMLAELVNDLGSLSGWNTASAPCVKAVPGSNF